MADKKSNGPRNIADAIKGREEAEEDIRTRQAKSHRSPETQDAVDKWLSE